MIEHYPLRRTAACITVMLFTAIAQAGERSSSGPQARHVHGSAQMNLVVDGRHVHIELISPAFNLLGFEHTPASEADHAARRSAFSTLEDAGRLFRFDKAANCRAEHAEIASGSMLTAQPAGEDAHHHHEEDDGKHRDTDHADITVTYRFFCDAPEGPGTLHVDLFDAFPEIDNLVVQYITDSRQGGTTLSSGDPTVTF